MDYIPSCNDYSELIALLNDRFDIKLNENPNKKKQDDIDILGIESNKGIFCECKFKNELFDLKEFNDLIESSDIFNNINENIIISLLKADIQKLVLKKVKNIMLNY